MGHSELRRSVNSTPGGYKGDGDFQFEQAFVYSDSCWVVVSDIFYFHPENWGRFPF